MHEVGTRLDQILFKRFSQWSRSNWKQRIKDGHVWVHSKERKTIVSYNVKFNEEVFYNIPFIKENNSSIDNKNLEVIFEDDFILVLNKPANVVVHPSGSYQKNTLLNYLKEIRNKNENYFFVNRLDRETSGLVLIAKQSKIAGLLQKDFQNNKVKKIYKVIVKGELQPKKFYAQGFLYPDLEGVVRKKRKFVLLEKISKKNNSYTSIQNLIQEIQNELEKKIQGISGSHTFYNSKLYFNKIEFCHTDFFLEEVFQIKDSNKLKIPQKYSFLKAILHTGRTHQIRATLCSLGYPLVGDRLYGEDSNLYLDYISKKKNKEMLEEMEMNRTALHAFQLEFQHPITKQILLLRATLPEDMKKLLLLKSDFVI